SVGSAVPQWKADKVKLIAVGAAKRMALLPEVPTVAESGLPGYEAISWFGLFGPPGMPADIVTKINAEVRKVFADPDIKKNFLERQYFESIAGTPEQLTKYIKSDEPKWRKVIHDTKVKGERPPSFFETHRSATGIVERCSIGPRCDAPQHEAERPLNSQQLAGIAAGDGGDGRSVEAVRGRDVADRIVVGHVEGIVRSHDDMVGAVETHQLGELVGREYDGVEIDFLEIAGRRVRQVAVRIRARAPGVIDAAAVSGEIAAAVRGKNLQLGMPFEHAVEDQVVQRDGRVERVADHVVEVEAREPFGV